MPGDRRARLAREREVGARAAAARDGDVAVAARRERDRVAGHGRGERGRQLGVVVTRTVAAAARRRARAPPPRRAAAPSASGAPHQSVPYMRSPASPEAGDDEADVVEALVERRDAEVRVGLLLAQARDALGRGDQGRQRDVAARRPRGRAPIACEAEPPVASIGSSTSTLRPVRPSGSLR